MQNDIRRAARHQKTITKPIPEPTTASPTPHQALMGHTESSFHAPFPLQLYQGLHLWLVFSQNPKSLQHHQVEVRTVSVHRGPCLSHLSPALPGQTLASCLWLQSLVLAAGANEVSGAATGMLGQQMRSAVLPQPWVSCCTQNAGLGEPVCTQWWAVVEEQGRHWENSSGEKPWTL